MTIQIEDIDLTHKKITLVIPYADYKSQVDAYLRKVGKDFKAPGFRPGKVPLSIIEQRFGPEVKQEVLTQLISDRVMAAIEEKELRAISQPSLLEVQAEEGTDITVSASVEIIPEFEIKDYNGIELDMKVGEITDEDVDKAVDMYRQRHLVSEPVTDRAAQDKDYVKLDFQGSYNGESFEGSEANGYIVQLGTGQLIEGMEAPILGMEINEQKTITVDLPEAHPNKNIAGKPVDFSVTLRGIQLKTMPELTDEFAQKADPEKNFKDIADMKTRIREELQNMEREQAKQRAKKDLALKLVEMNPIDLPDGLLDEQIQFMKQEEKKKEAGQEAGAAAPEAEALTTEDREKHTDGAVKILREEFLLDKISRQLKIEISEADIDKEVASIAQMLGGGNIKKLKEEWMKSGLLARLHSRMKRNRTLDAILETASLKEELVDRKTIISDN
ncbi:MAG: trigger factor [Candidatus Nitrohelix vancouverensis]|uniref:Trigger factor n=1 Tax=Candidatus Nitrohelix vancouverensis TaxID=2705534 RepID=A0A7T0C1F2_9BACT|nr:MAG: trigger factor [Candidatus Nitrohelix vancouverensis]